MPHIGRKELACFASAMEQNAADDADGTFTMLLYLVDVFLQVGSDVFKVGCIVFADFVGTVFHYLLQVIDANVFAYMQDFEISDDISLRVEPAVIPMNHYAFAPPALGVGVSLKF